MEWHLSLEGTGPDADLTPETALQHKVAVAALKLVDALEKAGYPVDSANFTTGTIRGGGCDLLTESGLHPAIEARQQEIAAAQLAAAQDAEQ